MSIQPSLLRSLNAAPRPARGDWNGAPLAADTSQSAVLYLLGRVLTALGKTEQASQAMQRVREMEALELSKDAEVVCGNRFIQHLRDSFCASGLILSRTSARCKDSGNVLSKSPHAAAGPESQITAQRTMPAPPLLAAPGCTAAHRRSGRVTRR